VDEIGGLEEAIAYAREAAGIAPGTEAGIVEYAQIDFWSSLSYFALGAADVRASRVPLLPPGASEALDELEFRIGRNGEPMPMLPLEAMPPR
jgi:hypothetical protein